MPVVLTLLLTASALLNATVENRFAAWIDGRDHSIASLRAILGPELQEQRPRDLGFGLRRVDFNGDGQFLIVTAVVLDGTVLYVRGVAGSAEWKRARKPFPSRSPKRRMRMTAVVPQRWLLPRGIRPGQERG